MADLIKTLTEKYMKPELPTMNVGDTVRVTVRVKEGSRERNQAYEGIIIAQKHGGTLLLESRSGQGTTVQVSLKKNKTAGMALRSTDAEGFEIKTALTELADCLDSSFYDEKYMD